MSRKSSKKGEFTHVGLRAEDSQRIGALRDPSEKNRNGKGSYQSVWGIEALGL